MARGMGLSVLTSRAGMNANAGLTASNGKHSEPVVVLWWCS